MKKVMLIFGTRPEAIKMAPVYLALKKAKNLTPMVCVTAQHRGLLDQVLELFEIEPDFDLNIMQPNQNLFEITSHALLGIKDVLNIAKPDMVLVHGDTTTTLAGCLAAFYAHIPEGHVEAGLRTGDLNAPFPEEMNRRVVDAISTLHFAPTPIAAENLAMEHVPLASTFMTGNTAIDALKIAAAKDLVVSDIITQLVSQSPMILMTAHRRENFGRPFEEIFATIAMFANANPHVRIVYPVHPNPNVKVPATRHLGGIKNISMIDPVDYTEMVYLMKHCQFIVTDSGGLQEEAPTLGKPVLVLRETTERPEAVAAGCAALVGHSQHKIYRLMTELLDTNSERYRSMSQATNPFGDGTASDKIVASIKLYFAAEREAYQPSIGTGLNLQAAQNVEKVTPQ